MSAPRDTRPGRNEGDSRPREHREKAAHRFAGSVPLLHVTGGRVPLNRLIFERGAVIPTSDDQDYCSDATRRAESVLDLPSSVYFFAGRALPDFGDAVLEFSPTIEEEWFTNGKEGCATPFDTGGIVAGFIRFRVPDDKRQCFARVPLEEGEPEEDALRALTEKLTADGVVSSSVEVLDAADSYQILDTESLTLFNVDTKIHGDEFFLEAWRPTDDELRAIFSRSRLTLAERWRRHFGRFVASNFNSPGEYLTASPSQDDADDLFSLNTDSRAWTFEVRVHAPVTAMECRKCIVNRGTYEQILREAVNIETTRTGEGTAAFQFVHEKLELPANSMLSPVDAANHRLQSEIERIA